jgi:lipoprotein-anchoring transpeptidase ErfK/SrfK
VAAAIARPRKNAQESRVFAFFPPNLLPKITESVSRNSFEGQRGITVRASSVLVLAAFALAASLGVAGAQPYPPPPGGYYPPPPSQYYPPPPQPYSGAPLPPQGMGEAPEPPPSPYDQPPPDYRNAGAPPGAYGSGPYGPAYGAPSPPQEAMGSEYTPRPPDSVGSGGPEVTGSVPGAPGAASADRATMLAALPPEERPEQGPPKELPPNLRRQLVNYPTPEPAGTIIIDTPNTYLYLVLGHGQALRYGIGVGREGFTWSGTERIRRMSEWPDWHPPKEMIERQPYLPRFMAGGEGNPLGARALYLGNTLYRIHGTNQPSTIGSFVSSGCIRLTNEDIEDLYNRVSVGTRVVVLPGTMPASAAAQTPVAH